VRVKKEESVLRAAANATAAFNTPIFSTDWCDSLIVFIDLGTVNSGSITFTLEDVDENDKAYGTRSAFISTSTVDGAYVISGPLATRSRIAATGTFNIDDIAIRIVKIAEGVR
jgi:hypothetical protein